MVYTNKQPSLYLNGVWVRTGLTSPRTAVHPSPQFGGDTLAYGHFAGLVDEPSIYNRSLSPAEIESIYVAVSEGKWAVSLGFSRFGCSLVIFQWSWAGGWEHC